MKGPIHLPQKIVNDDLMHKEASFFGKPFFMQSSLQFLYLKTLFSINDLIFCLITILDKDNSVGKSPRKFNLNFHAKIESIGVDLVVNFGDKLQITLL